MSEERIDAIVDTAGAPRCPFLGQHNECLIYEHRPLPCRLEGAPMIDRCDGLFGDWCELNFRDGVPETALNDLRLDYYGIQNTERIVTESLSEDFLQKRQSDVTVFIPSVIVEFESFWSTRLL